MNNTYYILRHGEALSNREKFISCFPEKRYSPLTEKGKKGIRAKVKELNQKKIDLIFSSDLERCSQTAKIIKEALGVKINYDKRLREYNVGILNGKSIEELHRFFETEKERLELKPLKGETYRQIVERMYNFLKEIDKKYSNKKILIISHQAPLTLLEGKVRGLTDEEILEQYPETKRIKTGEIRKLEGEI